LIPARGFCVVISEQDIAGKKNTRILVQNLHFSVWGGTVPSLGLILSGLLIKNLAVTMLPGIVIHVAISSLFAFLSTKFLGNR